ncbi:unnamed protein product [Polarella glacialis]|uniref:Polynucleotide adenylyltransferase n=1 Tax=Polarella glacialis TaxID=89957 RepID=A0A813FYP2_POLGL|nr:unnamed protein product [Polarella glacialis]
MAGVACPQLLSRPSPAAPRGRHLGRHQLEASLLPWPATGGSSSSSSSSGRSRRSPAAAALAVVTACGSFGSLCRRWPRQWGHRSQRQRPVSVAAAAIDSSAGFPLPLELDSWLAEAKLHADLAADVAERFGHVPQQAARVIDDAVARIERGARQCVAPCASAHPFGSTVNGFGEASSDLDVLIAVDDEELCYYMSYVSWHQREQRHQEALRRSEESGLRLPEMPHPTTISEKIAMSCAVQQLAEFLPELGFRVVRTLPRARKPLVTLIDRTGELEECDVSINNRLPLCNSELLLSYSCLDCRVRPLVLLVKAWAKGKKVCGAHEGNLSSYAWTIMVIYFLQLVNLLPSLQLLASGPRPILDSDYWGYERSFDTSFLTAEDYLQKVQAGEVAGCQGEAKHSLSMGQLLYGFFRFFSKEYSWGSEVVSIRAPERRGADAWWRLYGKCHPEPGIHVEDPIELRDLNIVMRRERLAQLKAEFDRATSMLEKGSSLGELLASEPVANVMSAPYQSRRFRQNRHRAIRLPKLARPGF